MSLTKVTYAMIEGAPINPLDYGAVGDGVADDTAGFLLAVAAAKAANQPLDISNLKINLATQNASIDSDGLFIQGNGIITTYVDYDYQRGTNNFNTHKTAALDKIGSVIFSQYNGPIFTGKTFSGNNFSIFGDLTKSSQSGFKQTTPTVYPGWSQAFSNLSDFYVANVGNCGLWTLGGLEVTTLLNVNTFQVGQYGLRVQTTTGVNSPIEYLYIANCSFQWSYWTNISLEGANKQITITNCLLNAPQWLPQKLDAGFTINNYNDLIPCIYINSPENSAGSFTFNIVNNYAEQTNAFLTLNCNLGYRQQGVVVSNNVVYLDAVSSDYYLVRFDATQFDFTAFNNRINQGVVYYFPTSAISGACQFMNFLDESTIFPPIFAGVPPAEQNILPKQTWNTSVGLGTGSAATFTYTVPTMTSPLNGNQIVPHLYLITANFQTDSFDTVGSYLMMVMRMSSGNYVGTTLAFGSTTGFSSAPTISTAGVISVPLSANYRARVSRIDNFPLAPTYPVSLP